MISIEETSLIADAYFFLVKKVPKTRQRGEGISISLLPFGILSSLKRHKEGRLPLFGFSRLLFGCPVYQSSLPRCLAKCISLQGTPEQRQRLSSFLRRSGRAGQRIRRFNDLVPERELLWKTICAPVKFGVAKGCPLGDLLVTFQSIEK